MMRVGHGYDIHRFEENSTKSFIVLGGVSIPYEKGILAHSDGDVVIHALIDAMLGACALGDIGKHFPDTDPQYKDKDSRVFLKHVLEKVNACGYEIGNADISIIAQAPKLAPYIMAMQENMAQDLQISLNCINVKATTHEHLDAIGQKMGIAAHAVVLVVRK